MCYLFDKLTKFERKLKNYVFILGFRRNPVSELHIYSRPSPIHDSDINIRGINFQMFEKLGMRNLLLKDNPALCLFTEPGNQQYQHGCFANF
jgi:hypothetical protein